MSLAESELVATLLGEPHHDGSDMYVLERPAAPGGDAVVRLRMPRGAADEVALRYVRDGEPRGVVAELDHETETETWWRAPLPGLEPVDVLPLGTRGRRARLRVGDGLGLAPADVADADDFVLTLSPPGPDWHLGSVVYQVFPDRFASSGLEADAPEWAIRRGWDELPTGRGPKTAHELFGGDLYGVDRPPRPRRAARRERCST